MNLFKKNNGITLIALIITILVMVTIASVSIKLIINDKIIGIAADAKEKYKMAEDKELSELENVTMRIKEPKITEQNNVVVDLPTPIPTEIEPEYEVTFNNRGATTVGSQKVTATLNANLPAITVPTKSGFQFNGYYFLTKERNMTWSYGAHDDSTTKRISFIQNSNGWKLTKAGDEGTEVKAKILIKDINVTEAPNVDFNDISFTPTKIEHVDDTWIIYINLILTGNMISKRGNINYESGYRFIDINRINSSSTVTLEYLTKKEDVKNMTWSYGAHDDSTTKRISFIQSSNGWSLTKQGDTGTVIQAKILVKDINVTEAPNVDFNDISFIPTKIEHVDDTWIIYVDLKITDNMVSKRGNINYESGYRFIDINKINSSSNITIEYLNKDGKEYYDSNGNNIWPCDFENDIILDAMWK